MEQADTGERKRRAHGASMSERLVSARKTASGVITLSYVIVLAAIGYLLARFVGAAIGAVIGFSFGLALDAVLETVFEVLGEIAKAQDQ